MDFTGKDRRGYSIVFQQSRWDHAIERGHFGRLKGRWQTVMTAFAEATLIIDNAPLEDGYEFGPIRAPNSERYVQWVDDFGSYVVIPARIQITPLSRPGSTTLDPPIAIAQTAYTTDTIPDHTQVIFRWPPSDPTKS